MIVRLVVVVLVGAAFLVVRARLRRHRVRPDDAAPAADHIVFLDLGERTVVALEDASLEDDALGGPDTTPR